MLKRQRPASPPPPSFSSVPLVSDAPGDLISIEQHQSKRRRTAPPSLDGPSRGWATTSQSPGRGCGWPGLNPHGDDADDDAEEEYYSDDQGDCSGGVDGDENGASPSLLGPHASEYTSTNTMLRELHTLHQHRLLFSSPSGNQFLHSNTQPNLAPHYYSNPSPNSRAYSHYLQTTPLNKGGMIPQPDKSRISLPLQGPEPLPSMAISSSALPIPTLDMSKGSYHPPPPPHQMPQQHQLQDTLCEETTRVSERYESTNRLIGSWFLSRRRALDSMDDSSCSS